MNFKCRLKIIFAEMDIKQSDFAKKSASTARLLVPLFGIELSQDLILHI